MTENGNGNGHQSLEIYDSKTFNTAWGQKLRWAIISQTMMITLIVIMISTILVFVSWDFHELVDGKIVTISKRIITGKDWIDFMKVVIPAFYTARKGPGMIKVIGQSFGKNGKTA